MSTVKVVRGARILTADLYGEPRPKAARPPRKVFFKCPEPDCGYEHAQWNLIGQHLYHHHGYSQESIDLEECEQRKTRRNKNWLKKRLVALDTPFEPYIDDDGNEIIGEEDENREELQIDMKPSPIVLEAMRKLLPRHNGPFLQKDGCVCPLPECAELVPNRVELVNHAKTIHAHHPTAVGNFEIRTELFENELDFKDWKLRLESEFGMYYSCESTGKQGDCKNFFFVCHRSGRVVRRMKQMRERRMRERMAAASDDGTALNISPKKRNKIVKNQEYCSAFMRARRDPLGRFHVAYCTSHIGHDQDPAMLPLTSAMKTIIYDRIVVEHDNASNSLIASRIRDAYPDTNSRMHYVTMTDVIEVIRMERKRLARVGGEEQENALEIFRGTTKKGRRKMGQELLTTGERHKPPRPGMGLMGRKRAREEEEDEEDDDEREMEMEDEMDNKDGIVQVHMHGYSHINKIDEVEEEDMGEMIEEGVMDDDHAAYYDDEEEVEEHVHSGFVDDDVVDDSMLETNQQEDEDDDGMPHLSASSSRVVVVRPNQRVQEQMLPQQQQQVVMEDVVSSKHRMDEHVDNICEALVRNGDAAALQAYLDAIRNVSSRYEHLLGR
uniref:C2H2-type domain-containing protein n=1 Tax=Pristionchus pacificus TaxID=54126 RepID=A0A8R1YIU5_PRIPA